MKRIFLFLLTNIAVLVVLSVVVRLLGLDRALADPGAHLHLYDKREVFERRKMGHLTVSAADPDIALERARAAVAELHWEEDP